MERAMSMRDMGKENTENAVRDLLITALAEDVGSGDITTNAIVDDDAWAMGIIVGHEPGVMAGGPFIDMLFALLGSETVWKWHVEEGERFAAETILGRIRTRAPILLTGERLALNILQRLCGIACITRQFADEIGGTSVKLLDTRKTSPGLRLIERYAVRMGGGTNHRFGLFDRVLIKENHLVFMDDPSNAVHAARAAYPAATVEIEVSNDEEFRSALSASPDWILLDNMSIDQMLQCVEIRNSSPGERVYLEASGGVHMNTIADIAATGIDAVSVGALTHSAVWLDISMDVSRG